MIHIKIKNTNPVILNCYKNQKNDKIFQLVIDLKTYEIINKPEKYDIDVSIVYSRVVNLLMKGEELPDELVAEWG